MGEVRPIPSRPVSNCGSAAVDSRPGLPVRRTRGALTALWLAIVAIWWVVASQLSRVAGSSARYWTEICFGVGLLLTYVAIWAIVASWLRAPPRRVLLRALATTGTLCALVLLLELPAMVGLVSYAPLLEATAITDAFVDDAQLSFRRPSRQSWAGVLGGDVVSGWNLPIGAPKQISFTTDALGFRNRVTREQADVVLLGDSYVEGWHVSDDETAAVVLERLLARPVSNLGVSGFGTLQQLIVLRRFALPLRPKLAVWFFFEGNDLYDDQEFENMLVYLEDHDIAELGADTGSGVDWSRRRRASFVRNAYGLVRRASHTFVRQALPPHGWYRDQTGVRHQLFFYNYAALTFTDYEEERFETTKATFREGLALGREQGVAMALLFVPMKFRGLHLAGDNANLTDLYLYFLPESAINLVWPMSGRVRPTMSARGSSSRPKNSHACTMSWRG